MVAISGHRVAPVTLRDICGNGAGRRHDLLRRVGVVLRLAGEVLIVGGEVEVAVAAEVEQDGAPIARLAGGQRLVDGGAYGVGGLRRGQDPLRAGELERRLE